MRWRVQTAESFNKMAAVADKPSWVLTALKLIAPDAGNAVYISFMQYLFKVRGHKGRYPGLGHITTL